MTNPHAKKPFPLAIFENSRLKPRHVFTFWTLCNHVETDSEGWISLNRQEFNHLIKENVPIATSNSVLILELLASSGFIELQRYKQDPYNRNTTTKILVRVLPTVWEGVVVRKTESQTPEMRSYYKERYLLKRAALLQERQLALNTGVVT
jgi:hypothetical protein